MRSPATPTARAIVIAAVVGGAVSCDDGAATQLLVVVSVQPAEGLPIDAVEVEVQSEDALTTFDRGSFSVVGAVGGRFTLPLTFGVAPLPRRRARAASGGSDARPLIASALTSFLDGQRLLLPLVLDYRCTLQPPCVPGQSCGANGCASDARDPALLRALGPGEAAVPAPASACRRPAEACIDRCDEGARVALSRVVDRRTDQHTLTTSDTTPCSDCAVMTRQAFYVSPTARPDLVPLYICRAEQGQTLYSLLQDCETYNFNDGVLGYIVAPATPGRCGAVALYRLYNEATFDHYYTTSASERDALVRTGGYAFEMITGYVWPEPPTP